MNKLMILLAFLSFSALLNSEEKGPEKAKEETPNYQTISATIEGAIKAIEAKDTEKLFNEFVSPKDLKAMKENEGAYEAAIKEFMTSEKAGALLFVLKKLKDITPVYNKEKDILVFKEKDAHLITFSRENAKWYIKN